MSEFKKVNYYGQELTGFATVDKPWERSYPEGACDLSKFPKMTAYDYLKQENKNHLDEVAIVYFGGEITFEEIFRAIDDAAKSFKEMGIEKGQFVTMGPLNIPEYFISLMAISKIGAVANMIAPTFTDEQMISRIGETESNLLLVVDKIYNRYTKAIKELGIKNVVIMSPVDSIPKKVKLEQLKKYPVKTIKGILNPEFKIPKDSGYMKWADFIKDAKNSTKKTDAGYEPRRPFVMVYSSGSTGAAKGIILPNESFTAMSHMHKVAGWNFPRGKVNYDIIPPFFSTSLNSCIYNPMGLGIKTVMQPAVDPNEMAKDITKYKPDYVISAPALWAGTIGNPNLVDADLSGAIYFVAGGERLHPRLRKAIEMVYGEYGFTAGMRSGYGQCEGGAGMTFTDDESITKPGNSGKPLPGVIMGIFDPITDKELTYNQRGRIRVWTPCQMNEYYKNPTATNEYYDLGKDGLADTGDFGYMDEEGNLYSEGRYSDTISLPDGTMIPLVDIEDVIFEDNACIEAMPPEVQGIKVIDVEVPVAFIAIKPEYYGMEKEIILRIDKLCQEKLSKESIPWGYKFIKSFGVAPNGKRDYSPLKNDRDGYYKPDSNGEIMEVSFPNDSLPVYSYIDFIPSLSEKSLVLTKK